MTRVYLVYEGQYDERDVRSVHATLEGAQAAARRTDHEHEWSVADYDPDEMSCRWHRRVHVAPVPMVGEIGTGRVKAFAGVATLPDGRTVKVPAGVEWVSYPIPPERWPEPERSWTEACDIAIVAYDLLA
jgi:hypothetical protein